MKKKLILIIGLLLTFLSIFGISFEELYKQNLNKSSTYVQAEMNLKNAELEMKQIDQFFLPYVQVSLDTILKANILSSEGFLIKESETSVGGILFDSSGDIIGYSFSLKTNFAEVFGTNIGLSFPFKIYFETSPKGDEEGFYGPWNLSDQIAVVASRDLTKIDKAERLSTESKYYSALSSYYLAQTNEFINTVEDIFNRYYNEKTIELTQKQIDILKNQYESATEEKAKDEIEKQILTAQKTLEGLKANNVSLEYFDFTEDLYTETRNIIDTIISQNTDVSIDLSERLDLKALHLNEESSKIQKKFWFLPYLPFSTLTLKVQPFTSDENDEWKPSWSIGLDFQLTIFDKGERKLASDNMKSNLANLTYEESLKQIEETIMGLETKRKTLNFDVSINQIDLKNAQEDYEKNIDLYKKGFITQDDLSLSEIALQMNKLNLENTENSLKVNELRLMQQYYVNLWGDNN